jgi:hypothetical protein
VASHSVIRFSAVVILLLTSVLQGCATARMERHLKQAVGSLQQKSDADSLAAAGLLSPSEGKSGLAVELLTSATAVAPERADLAWLSIQICRGVTACDPEPEVARLRTLDPSNGAGWLNAVARVNASDNEAARNAVLSELARAQRVDIYWTTLIVHLTRALADTRKISLEEALVTVIGVLAAQAIPAYSATSSLCKGERLNNDEVIQDCRRVALSFEQGDTFITEMIGVAIAQRVWPADSAEWNAAAEQRRVSKYRMHMGLKSELQSGLGARWAEEYLSLCAQYRREQDMVLAEIIKAGKNPDPPANWTAP